MIFIKLFLNIFLNFLRNVRLVDNITNFYFKIVEFCLNLKKIFEKIISILQFSIFEKNSLKFMASHFDNFWENLGNFWEKFF